MTTGRRVYPNPLATTRESLTAGRRISLLNRLLLISRSCKRASKYDALAPKYGAVLVSRGEARRSSEGSTFLRQNAPSPKVRSPPPAGPQQPGHRLHGDPPVRRQSLTPPTANTYSDADSKRTSRTDDANNNKKLLTPSNTLLLARPATRRARRFTVTPKTPHFTHTDTPTDPTPVPQFIQLTPHST